MNRKYTINSLARIGLVSAPILLVSGIAPAETIDVSANVVPAVATCATSFEAVDFGDVQAGETVSIGDNDANFDLNFNCSSAVTGATATFDGGLNPSAGGTVRTMAGPGTGSISYTINEPPSLLITVGETLTFDLPSGISSIPLVGRISAQTLPTTLGAYSDTISVTLTF